MLYCNRIRRNRTQIGWVNVPEEERAGVNKKLEQLQQTFNSIINQKLIKENRSQSVKSSDFSTIEQETVTIRRETMFCIEFESVNNEQISSSVVVECIKTAELLSLPTLLLMERKMSHG